MITTRLLEDPLTGKKIMNKSEGQYISLNDSASEMFGKTMAMPDSAIMPLLSFATELPDSRIDEAKKRLEASENPKTLKEELAYEFVRMYHGEKEAQKAKEEFRKSFFGRTTAGKHRRNQKLQQYHSNDVDGGHCEFKIRSKEIN